MLIGELNDSDRLRLLQELEADVLAPSTAGSRVSHIKTWLLADSIGLYPCGELG